MILGIGNKIGNMKSQLTWLNVSPVAYWNIFSMTGESIDLYLFCFFGDPKNGASWTVLNLALAVDFFFCWAFFVSNTLLWYVFFFKGWQRLRKTLLTWEQLWKTKRNIYIYNMWIVWWYDVVQWVGCAGSFH